MKSPMRECNAHALDNGTWKAPSPRSSRRTTLVGADMTNRIKIGIVAALLAACQGRGPDGVTVDAASVESGIRGEGQLGAAWISFESRRSQGRVAASIRGSDGLALVEYAEFEAEIVPITASDGSVIKVSRAPELRILGQPYGTTAERKADLSKLAASGEGALIRELGLTLVRLAPGSGLTPERRALELPLQALWRSFPGWHSEAAVLNADYEIGPAGYFVLTQPEGLALEVNHIPTAISIPSGNPLQTATSGPQSTRRSPRHDDDMVSGCFGRCGSGCTGGIAGGIIDPWPSSWEDTQGAQFLAHEEYHCHDGSDVLYYFYATPTTHSVSGWWSPGCQLHDNCCLGGFLTCWTVCDVLLPEAAALSPFGEVRTWAYTDYSWDIQTFDAGYSGCTCPGSETMITFDCLE